MDRVDIELLAYIPSYGDLEPKGANLRLANGREAYLDFNAGTVTTEYNELYGTGRTEVRGAAVLDKENGEEIKDITMEALQDAEVTAVHVRCETEEGLYYEPIAAGVSHVLSDGRDVNAGLLLSDKLKVSAADRGGNDWSVAPRKPELDAIIADAQARSMASHDKGKSRENDKERG